MTRGRLALHLAWSFLREGRAQSVLILAGVTVGVAAFVFISALVTSMQSDLVERTLGNQAHLIILSETPPPRPLMAPGDALIARRVEPAEPRRRPFDQWQRAAERLAATPGVIAVCPKVTGSALALRGGTERAVQVVGADPGRLRQIVDLPNHIVAGRYRLGADDAVIGMGLAEDLGVGVGSPLRLSTGSEMGVREQVVRVGGIVSMGQAAIDDAWVVVSLRTGQMLLDRNGDVTEIEARVAAIFDAGDIAAEVSRRTGLEVESWIDRNAQLTSALQSQNAATGLIRVFVMLSVAMGIASVLVVTIVQRRGQIGVLRAIGVTRWTVLEVFLWQGALLGMAGAVFGTLLGIIATKALGGLVFFEVGYDVTLFIAAAVISLTTGLVAAAIPARQASRLDPATAIRGDG